MRSLRPHVAAAYLVAYLVASYLGRQAVLEGTGLALFWPAAGVVALWMVRGTNREQLLLDAALVLVGTFALNTVLGIGPAPASLFAVANLAQGLVVRTLSARLEGMPLTSRLPRRIATVRDLVDLALASAGAAVLSATFGTWAGYLASGNWGLDTVLSWVVRNSCGTFVVVAATMAVMTTLNSERVRRGGWRAVLSTHDRRYVPAELVVATAAAVAVNWTVFATDEQLPIAYMSIAAAAWIGFRFSPLVAGLNTAWLGILAVICTLEGLGPFGLIRNLTVRAEIVQLFVVVTAAILLVLSLAVAQREEMRLEAVRSAGEASDRARMLHAITESLLDGLAVVDSEGRVVLSNPAAVRLLAPRRDDRHVGLPDRHGLRRADGSSLPAEEMPHLAALAGTQVRNLDVLRIDPATGAQTTLEVDASPLDLDAIGRVAVLNVRDVTQDRAQLRNLEAFAGVAAHDLQSPLSAVLSWADLLREQLTEREGDFSLEGESVRHIESAATRMHELISDLLSYTLASSRPLEVREISLDALVDDVAAPLAGLADVRRSSLGSVTADPVLVRQLFSNLVGNAVKYVAPDTRPVVEISTLDVGDRVEVAVCDNGIGIPADERGRVFDNFFRASTSTGYQGTGLGLAICASAVQRHGGTIAARARVDGPGSMFVFTLPRTETQHAARPQEMARSGR